MLINFINWTICLTFAMTINYSKYLQLFISSSNNEVVDVSVIWTDGSSITHRIDSLSPVNGKYKNIISFFNCRIFSP